MPQTKNQALAAKAQAKGGAKAKQSKRIAKQMGAKVMERLEAPVRENPYLRCLVNPEQWQCSYPDNYGEKTAVCKFVTNRTVTWDSDGAYWVSVNPTLPDHVVTSQPSQSAGTYGYTSVTKFQRPVVIKQGPGEFLTLNSAIGAKDSLGNQKMLLASGNTIAFPPNMTGTGLVYLVTPDTGSLTYTILWGDNSTTTITPNGGAATIPQAATTMALGITTSATTASVSSVQLSFQLAEAAGVKTKVVVPCQNYSDLVPTTTTSPNAPAIFEEYRTVAMSVLLTYEGDTLYNGGNCTGRVVSGGDAPGDLGWTSYSAIASLPDSYEGPLIMGAYGFWVPTDTKDMQFRDCSVANDGGDLPSLVFAGVVKNPSNAVLRLRTCLVLEAKTYKPYISTSYSMVAPPLIDAAAVALRGIPRIMENPLHLEDIKEFLRNVVQKGKAVYDAAAPVVKAVAPLLL